MKNSIKCPDCNSDNPFYNYTCDNCRYYLRDRIYNLDLWPLLIMLIDSPSNAFRKIIQSEHKNFIFFILLFISLKYVINTRFISMLSLGEFYSTLELFYSYLIVLAMVALYFIAFSFYHTTLGKKNDLAIRFKDTFALIIYSQVPFLFGLMLLFTLELVLFGDYLFSKNPTPFIIKGFLAYLFLTLEFSVVIWSAILVFKAMLVQTQQKYFSFLQSSAFVLFFWMLIYICSLFVFTI